MAFFLRKSFSAGPVRLNLSKGGLGLSAGITGARVGLNRRGAYVYGGRHGLYYRESLTKRNTKKNSTYIDAQSEPEIVEIYKDTGIPFENFFKGSTEYVNPANNLPSIYKKILTPAFTVSFAFLILGGAFNNSFLSTFWFLPILIGITYAIYANTSRHSIERKLKNAAEKLSDPNSNQSLVEELINYSPPYPYKKFYQTNVSILILHHFVTQENIPDRFAINELLSKIDLSGDVIVDIKRFVLNQVFNDFIEDMALSPEQEKILSKIVTAFNLERYEIEDIYSAIEALSDIRNQIESELESIKTSIHLVRGEECYYLSEVKLLKLKSIGNKQKDGIRYKFIGYDLEMEGTIYLTDRRLLIIDNGSREFRYNKVLDVILSLEDNTVTIILADRVNPIILSTPNSAILAGKLERLLRLSKL